MSQARRAMLRCRRALGTGSPSLAPGMLSTLRARLPAATNSTQCPAASPARHLSLFTALKAAAASPVAEPAEPSERPLDPAPRVYGDQFWRKVPIWEDVEPEQFFSNVWAGKNDIRGKRRLLSFLSSVLPEQVPLNAEGAMQSRDDFIRDVTEAFAISTMEVRITPYMLSRVNWKDPRHDPIARQFIPLRSLMVPDHPSLTLDSLEEEADSPVPGLVHRYPDKALFLGRSPPEKPAPLKTTKSGSREPKLTRIPATSTCPTYCMFCTRSYAVGGNTESVTKASQRPKQERWERMFEYIEGQEGLHDIVVSGGDSYTLDPQRLWEIGTRLVAMDNIRRFRFASKGLAVSPGRILDGSDRWFDALVAVSNLARKKGKAVALHTHFNHPNEISWVARMAAQKLYEAGVTVRNQTVLLRGVNDDFETMSKLIRGLADMNITPYYVYQCDMVRSIEHLRTPLQTILDLESRIRGSIAGFMTPQFVVDLPGGGGKRLACSYKTYDRESGVSTFVAPAVTGRGKENKTYEYHDPLPVVEDQS